MANESFLRTIAKYPTFLAGALLGVFFSVFGWTRPLYRNWLSGTLVTAALLGLIAFLALTVRAMLQAG